MSHKIRSLLNTIEFLKMRSRAEYIVVNAWTDIYTSGPRNQNLGDDLNYYLLKELTGKEIVNQYNLYQKFHVNYCCVGSILDSSLVNENSVVWGAGALLGECPIKMKPRKVCAVRGPLTRHYLQSQNIECPSVFGDPALLLPIVYQPVGKKKYKVGVIPHYSDLRTDKLRLFLSQCGEGVQVIKLRGYGDWKKVIDEINECDFIVSSSLHGIIISDAYNIPNVWVEFSDHVLGNGFKFRDYFLSVGRRVSCPVAINESSNLDDLLAIGEQWSPIQFDKSSLIHSCPFAIKEKYLRDY